MCLIHHCRSRLCGGKAAWPSGLPECSTALLQPHILTNYTGLVRGEELRPSVHGHHVRLEGYPYLLLNVPQSSACWDSISCLLGWKARSTEMSEVPAMQYLHPTLFYLNLLECIILQEAEIKLR